jgi:hypothetical protein
MISKNRLTVAAGVLGVLILLFGMSINPSQAALKRTALPVDTYCQGADPSQPVSGPTKVMVIVGENESSTKINSTDTPFQADTLAAQCGSLANMHGETHGSESNYHAMVSGQYANWALCDFPPDDNGAHACTYGPVTDYGTTPSIMSQLGTNWKIYNESMATNCQPYDGTVLAPYAVRHNPGPYFPNTNCSTQDVPLTQLPTDLAANALPAFSMIIPDANDDGHNTSITSYDTFLATELTTLQATSDYQSGNLIIVVTYDEGSTFSDYSIGENCADPSQGTTKPSCQIASYVVGRYVPHTSDSDFTTHYSVLKTAEEITGQTPLANAATANDFRTIFNLAPVSSPSPTPTPTPPSNLFANGDFESASPLPTGYARQSYEILSRVTTPVHGGSYAFMISSTHAAPAATVGFNSPAITGIASGTLLTFKCWVQATSANLKVHLRLSEGSGSTYTALNDITSATLTSGTWTQETVTGTTIHTGDQVLAEGYSNNLTSATGGEVFDDCSVST